MLHQLIELFKCRTTTALVAFSDQAELLDHGDRIVEFLPRQWIAPRSPRHREDVGQVSKVVAAGLGFDGLCRITRECHELLTGDVAASGFAKIAVLYGLEDLRLCSRDGVLGFVDITLDCCGNKGILFLLESTWTLKLSLSLHDPGIGRLFTIECLGLAVDDRPALFERDLGEQGFRAVFARSGAYRSHLVVVLSVGVVGRSYGRNFGTTGTGKVQQCCTAGAEIAHNEPETVQHWTEQELQKWP